MLTWLVTPQHDPEVVTYEELLGVFWERHDPTTKNRQGNDVGTQYRSAIFYYTEEQKEAAERSLEAEEARTGKTIVTEITRAGKFWAAESHHQQYLEKGGQCALKGDSSNIRCYG